MLPACANTFGVPYINLTAIANIESYVFIPNHVIGGMVVRNKMNQTRTSTKDFARTVLVSEPVPIEEVQVGMDSVRQRIESGRALLQVVAYPWGVEFAVCDVGDQP